VSDDSGLTRRSRAHAENERWEKQNAEWRAELKHHIDYVRKHWIYRCWDAEGRLLYIGCTEDVEQRIAVHRASWNNPASAYIALHMDRYEAEGPYSGRIAGRAAEKAAIEAEAPLLNVHHNKGRGNRDLDQFPRPSAITDEQRAELHRVLDQFGRSA
jgi:hypothetical protein